jgi:hypothetical protein
MTITTMEAELKDVERTGRGLPEGNITAFTTTN